mgnify:CR=1
SHPLVKLQSLQLERLKNHRQLNLPQKLANLLPSHPLVKLQSLQLERLKN